MWLPGVVVGRGLSAHPLAPAARPLLHARVVLEVSPDGTCREGESRLLLPAARLEATPFATELSEVLRSECLAHHEALNLVTA